MISANVTLPRMIRAYHVIFTAYGFWLPNDQRGSWSEFVRNWELVRFGKATKTDERRSLARNPHDHDARRQAKRTLQRKPVSFTGHQALSIAAGFRNAIARSGYQLYACSILPEHVHGVLARSRYNIEYAVGQLKGEATKQLLRDGLHPFGQSGQLPSPWGRKGWKVFLNSDDEVRHAIGYVERNPVKEGKRPQHWPFVEPYEPS